jgi:hypothetical protein
VVVKVVVRTAVPAADTVDVRLEHTGWKGEAPDMEARRNLG